MTNLPTSYNLTIDAVLTRAVDIEVPLSFVELVITSAAPLTNIEDRPLRFLVASLLAYGDHTPATIIRDLEVRADTAD